MIDRKVNTSWPEGTPPAIGNLADSIWDAIRFQNGNVGGPAMILAMTRMLVCMRNKETSGEEVSGIMRDIGNVATKWGAAYDRDIN